MQNYAGFWIRVGAYIIDAIVLSIVGAIVGMLFGVGALGMNVDESQIASPGYLLYNVASLVIAIGYFAGMESSSWQATLGKKALGLIVTSTDGNRISLLNAIGRYLAKILSALILLIGFIMVGFTERKQGLHDLLASTLVLKADPGTVGHDPSVFE
ncbi:RDD family protein [Altererythrobacter sp. ZODW24]|uniref:RDD family protein n=1 Tax=Altererythrobacter sp. ZODW24 TaxID=2185142 RepID=UPI000DF7BB87|nr:RDD family protein [Altererythrobacter sp. ZODW24]